jgi:SAM-dependent methyltransferase
MSPRPCDRVGELADHYGSEAADYELYWAPVLRSLGVHLLRALPLAEAKLILDLGTGVGALLEEIRRASPNGLVAGIDRSEGMLRRADTSARAVMDAQRLALRAGTFDVIVMAFMLFHLLDPGRGLEEAGRVLRPGGTIGVATWGEHFNSPAFDAWDEELAAHGAPEQESILARHELVDTPEKLASLLATAGFSSIRSWSARPGFTTDLDHFVGWRTRLGPSKRRLLALDEPARTSCVTRARRRIEEMGPDGFRDRSEIILATARSQDGRDQPA